MNTFQALKKIVRDQFTRPAPAAKLAPAYYVVNSAAKTLVRHEPFRTEDEALAYIEFWRERGQVVKYLEVYAGARKMGDLQVDESYWKQVSL